MCVCVYVCLLVCVLRPPGARLADTKKEVLYCQTETLVADEGRLVSNILNRLNCMNHTQSVALECLTDVHH